MHRFYQENDLISLLSAKQSSLNKMKHEFEVKKVPIPDTVQPARPIPIIIIQQVSSRRLLAAL